MKQEMTYAERETLKQFAAGRPEEAAEMLVLIAHWHRQPKPIPFTDYAANWIAASRGDGRCHDRMSETYQLKGERMIGDGKSEWGSR